MTIRVWLSSGVIHDWLIREMVYPISEDHLHDYVTKGQSLVFKANGVKTIYNARHVSMIEVLYDTVGSR